MQRRLSLAWTLGLGLLFGCASAPPQGDWSDSEFRDQRFSQAELAYRRGEYETAVALLRPLAERSEARAQYSLGYLYFYGLGVTPDRSRAVNLFQQAATQGYSKAVKALAQLARGANPGAISPTD